MAEIRSRVHLLQYTTDVVSSYLENNRLESDDVPGLIETVFHVFAGLDEVASQSEQKRQPAVPIHESVQDDFIVCLEDGKKLKMLKRYLNTAYNLTPEEYRERWNLPSDYPMVAPSYAAKRSRLAKDIGLGTKK